MIDKNAVFTISSKWIGRPFIGLCRFLAVDAQGSAALIPIPKDHHCKKNLGGPKRVSLAEFSLQIERGNVLPAQCPPVKRAAKRSEAVDREFEKNKKIIYSLDLEDTILFNGPSMAKLLTKASDMHEVPERTIRRLLYAYYVGGQTEESLIPAFKKRGGEGQQNKDTAKRGRRPSDKKSKGSDIPLPDVREKLQDGVKKHWMPGENTFREAYVATMREHFPRRGADLNAKNFEDVVLPENQRPTKWQFLYMIRIVEKEEGKRRAIPGRRRQPEEREEIRGKATDGVLGPGFRFEIDATKQQIQLVSRWSRNEVVGNATIYIVTDVWSSAIVGYFFTLENPSWRIAASALANTFSSKGQIFERLGLDYVEADWPCHHLPSILMGDRAELLSESSRGVRKAGIKVEIAAPMCPEMKGTVESKFSEIKKTHHRLPGSYAKDRKRREKDGKDDALLTIDEAEKILVKAIIAINRQPVSPDRIPPEFFETGGGEISRIGLYSWGLKNKPGHTRTMSEDEYMYYLLSPGNGSVDSDGINFKGHVFRATCPMIELSANVDKVEVRFNEHNAQTIQFYHPCSDVWEEAFNVNQNIMRRPIAFYEWDLFRKQYGSLEEALRMQNAHESLQNRQGDNAIIRKAKSEKKKQQTVSGKPSKSRRAIRAHKAEEKSAVRVDATNQLLPVSALELTKAEDIVPRPTPESRPMTTTKSTAALTAGLWEDDNE